MALVNGEKAVARCSLCADAAKDGLSAEIVEVLFEVSIISLFVKTSLLSIFLILMKLALSCIVRTVMKQLKILKTSTACV